MATKAQMKELCKSTGGFICLHRSILKWEWSDEPMMVYFWTYLLLNAAAKTHPHRGTIIERGQLVTSLQKLSERTTLSQRSIRTMLKRLLNAKQIAIQSDTHFSRITICKYDTYQYDADIIDTRSDTPSDTRSDKAATSDRQATDKRPTTYNKGDTGDTGDIGDTNIPPYPLTGGIGGDASKTESFQLDSDQHKAKRERKPAQRNPIMDALATYAEGVHDLSQVTPSAWKQIAKAASDIKTVCPTVTADEIRRRVINYSLSMPNATCTSTAIAKHWARCDDARKPGSTVAETEEEAWARKAAEELKSWGMIPAN